MSVCAVCGAMVRPVFQMPAPELAPDLDFRPGEPARSTLRRWVAECSGCGAAAPDLASIRDADAAVVRDDPEYAALRDQAPACARSFLLWALLCQRRGDVWAAAEGLLQAAWAADDAEEAEWAQAWRLQAAALWPQSEEVQPRLCLIDIYRRAGAFDQATALADILTREPLDDNSAAIVSFQRRLIAQQETGRQLISSALRPPAARPHVSYSQVRREAGGLGALWRRLFVRD
ncbi:MAG TPA: hypothetical protein VL752_07720 [Acidisoma sp.]|uniref:hypothetical protein n=1 Tax=Acidisoma sp. TaxID=1872115 RepID=UPI002CEE0BAA|nr:hypothetical protein [Acidisoma sp.]HTI00818.1 hypothetical protein [Acidisoma sp.]